MNDQQEILQIGFDLGLITVEVLSIILMDEATEPGFFREVMEANPERPEILNVLLTHYKTPGDIRAEVSGLLHLPAPVERSLELARIDAEAQHEDEKMQTLLTRIQQMRVGDKIQLAMRGSRDVRSILIKDSNKEVVKTVMQNPKLTESEIELIAMNRNIPEEVLRIISTRREWVRNYGVVMALLTNPKTPVGISLGFMDRVKKQDLAKFERNKNIPEAIRATAKRLLAKTTKSPS